MLSYNQKKAKNKEKHLFLNMKAPEKFSEIKSILRRSLISLEFHM